MGITAKELAAKLNLSATAVSMALNNRPGVSRETKDMIIKAAEDYGYDFSRLKNQGCNGSIYVIFYRASNAILSFSPIFDKLYDGIKSELMKENIPSRVIQFYEKTDSLDLLFEDLRRSDCSGIILVGTELHKETCEKFMSLEIPFVLADSYFEALDCTSVGINNAQGAYLAADYLISVYRECPGHLKSTYSIPNFEEREFGFNRAVRENGMSPARCITHQISPSIEDAITDMLEIIDSGAPMARAYFADNDIIAIGAIKACKLRNIRVPEDVAIIGFDNIREGQIIEPALTTIDVPRFFEGVTAAHLLKQQIENKQLYHSSTKLNTKIIKRFSV